MAGKKKGRDVSALQIVDNARFVHPGCGVNALSDLQKRKKFNILQGSCRSDKHSASGNFAFVIIGAEMSHPR
ncbi:hypothetical protein EC326_007620 [Shigella sonnei]|uniref:hypothetical protein n=1 Tax=Shigella sonnei TaxID=624 RepID=UPI00129B0A3B|nr:hypothetical protein [Shigella sonnei]MBJ6791014.1 hypothetical protein [Shigella sonnei]MCW3776169.1 hypothetical protein [Shigella sonnei]QGK07683.1 hypothetical protein GJE15_07495 [Shigella sonnei]QJX85640.1 hypothetical protein G6O56_01810 [Shigella sonnei]QJX96104.1 hypothetical protein G6O58_15300 [Shigella sonnei]